MAKLTINERGSGANSGTADLSIMRSVANIQLKDDFSNLFPKNEAMVQTIADDMRLNGYDMSQPVHIWKEEKCLIDGHHRFYAAQAAGINEIPVYEHSFPDIEAAMEYALKLQVQRRNLNDSELYAAVLKIDTLKKRGRKALDGAEAPAGKSADHLGELLGTSGKKVEKIRAIEKKATEEVKEAVSSGKMSINAGYKTTRPAPAPKPAEIAEPENQTNDDPFDIGFDSAAEGSPDDESVVNENLTAEKKITLNVKFTLDESDEVILHELLQHMKKDYGIDFEM